MTPKRFFDTSGAPFAATELDDRAGIEHRRGCYEMAPATRKVKRLPPDVFAVVKAKAQEGARLLELKENRPAFAAFMEALNALPEPKQQWNAAGWILLAIAEVGIRAGRFDIAEDPITDAMICPGTIGNPWAHLRRGQVCFELGKMNEAGDELARAYMGGGREVFEGQDPKYFALVEKLLRPPQGMTSLP